MGIIDFIVGIWTTLHVAHVTHPLWNLLAWLGFDVKSGISDFTAALYFVVCGMFMIACTVPLLYRINEMNVRREHTNKRN